MNTKLTFSIADRIKSIRCAGHGIGIMLKFEHNAWVHTLATVLVLCLGLYLRLGRFEWCWLVLAVVTVWTAEALNTAFEFLADVASPNFHPMVEKAKDVAAGAVLIASIGSVIIGLLVFGPRLYARLVS
ncbi:MAG: diacylglycerol kinase family protein [Endomicrobiales bacterium]